MARLMASATIAAAGSTGDDIIRRFVDARLVAIVAVLTVPMSIAACGPLRRPIADEPPAAQRQPNPSHGPAYLPRVDVAPAPDLAIEGQVGGAIWAVAARGDVAYIGVGPRIIAYDLRPTDRGDAPSEMARSAVLGRTVRDLVLDGDRLYAAIGGAGVAVFDVADPSRIAPAAERDMRGEAGSLALDGGRLYVALGREGFAMLDATSGALEELGTWRAAPDGDGRPAKVFDIAPSGGVAFGAVDTHGLLAIDVSDPAHATVIGEDTAHGKARRVTLVGSTAWVAADNGEVHVFDVRDPARPRAFAQPGERFVYGDEATSGFALDGDRLVISGGPLEVWDVADPFVPRRLGGGPPEARVRHLEDSGDGVAMAGGRIVVTGGGGGDFVVVDTRDAAAQRVAARVPGFVEPWLPVFYGLPDGRTLESERVRFDVGDAARPRIVGPNPLILSDAKIWQEAAIEDGSLLFSVGFNAQGQLVAHDLGSPGPPRLLGVLSDKAAERTYPPGTASRGWIPDVLDKAGDRIVLSGWGVLAIVDAADPADMRLLAVRGVPLRDAVHAPAPAPAMNYAAVALSSDGRTAVGVDAGWHGDVGYTDSGGIQAIDLTDPSNPRFGPHLDTPFAQNDVAIHGHHAFVAAGKGGLRVYDIASVDATREVGAWDEGDEKAIAIEMAWPQVLLARSKRLDLIDVRDPGHPARVATASVPGVVKALRLYRGRAWVLTEDAGLLGYRFR